MTVKGMPRLSELQGMATTYTDKWKSNLVSWNIDEVKYFIQDMNMPVDRGDKTPLIRQENEQRRLDDVDVIDRIGVAAPVILNITDIDERAKARRTATDP